LESRLLQPISGPSIGRENTHQIVSVDNAEIENTSQRGADPQALSQARLAHRTDRMRDQLICDQGFVRMGSNAKQVEKSWGAGCGDFVTGCQPITAHTLAKVNHADRVFLVVNGEEQVLGPKIELAQDALIPQADSTPRSRIRSGEMFVPNLRE
jgi:hypothetical protein